MNTCVQSQGMLRISLVLSGIVPGLISHLPRSIFLESRRLHWGAPPPFWDETSWKVADCYEFLGELKKFHRNLGKCLGTLGNSRVNQGFVVTMESLEIPIKVNEIFGVWRPQCNLLPDSTELYSNLADPCPGRSVCSRSMPTSTSSFAWRS